MNERDTKKCPKCGTEMEKGEVPQSTAYGFRFKTRGEFWGSKIIPFCCRSCGYIELFTETKGKEEMS